MIADIYEVKIPYKSRYNFLIGERVTLVQEIMCRLFGTEPESLITEPGKLNRNKKFICII